MKVKEIVGTRNQVTIVFTKKAISLKGEMVLNGFWIEKDAIYQWDEPFQSERIDEKLKNEIILAIEVENEKNDFKIFFDQ